MVDEDQGAACTSIGIITEDTYEGGPFPDYTDAAVTEQLKLEYGWICQDDGKFTNGDNGDVIA